MEHIVKPREILIYATKQGKEPFSLCFGGLASGMFRRRILSRLRRLEHGNLGDCKHLSQGVFELRFRFGSGYRIYFGQSQRWTVLLLCGGDKGSQLRDITKAHEYWQEYQSRE